MWIERDIRRVIDTAARTRPAVLVTGARQTGKTSLLHRLFPKHHFVSLDLPSEAEQAERDAPGFLQRHPPPVIVDEVQYAPTLFRHLKILIDKERNRMGQVLLTGSQKHVLMRHASESLAGRVELVELETLSRHEIAGALGPVAVERQCVRGGYPELWANPAIGHAPFYRSYIATYLERDVRSLLNVSSLRDFERFLRACALRSGQLLNKAELARDVGVAPSTAGAWLSVLEASNIIVLLEPWHSNAGKSLTKSPKLYLADSGLLCSLLAIEREEELLRSPLVGAVWESFVFAELRKAQTAATGAWACHFWHDRTREVDFVVHRGGRFELYEAKWTGHPDHGDAANLHAIGRQLGEDRIIRKVVVCRTPNAYPIDDSAVAWSIDDLSQIAA